MKRFSRFAPWLAGLLAALLMLAALAAFGDFRYGGTDDTPILHAFMGYEGGAPASFNYCVHTALAWVLCGISTLFPGVAWYSILQLALAWLSAAVIVKSLAQLTQKRGWSAWTGALAGLLFLAAFVARYACHVSFTTTSALCVTASVAQLMSVGVSEKRAAGRVVGGAALLLCGYFLRMENLWPGLAFWVLTAVARALCGRTRGRARPMLAAALAGVVLLGGFAVEQKIEIDARGLRETIQWQEARSRLMDYTHFDTQTPAETLEAMGWSEDKLKLLANWCFMDEAFSTENFRTLYEAQPDAVEKLSFRERAEYMAANVRSGLTIDATLPPMLWTVAAMALLCVVLSALRRRLWPALCALAAVALCAAMLGYLGWVGRFIPRAAFCAVFPTAAFLVTLLPTAAGERGEIRGWRMLPALLAACLCLVPLCQTIIGTVPTLRTVVNLDREGVDNHADLDSLARDYPDMLLVTDLSLMLDDDRLFPDVSEGVPDNTVAWGGWEARSPGWYAALERYGIDELSLELFTRDNVLLASVDPAPSDRLLACIAESCGAEIEWDYYDSYGYVNLFQIYTY